MTDVCPESRTGDGQHCCFYYKGGSCCRCHADYQLRSVPKRPAHRSGRRTRNHQWGKR